MKKIIAVLLTACAVFSLVACTPQTEAILTVGDTSFTEAEFSIYYTICYADFLSSYDADEIGYDTSKSPKEQTCSLLTNGTWADFLLDTTVDFCRELAIVLTEAEKDGVSLTEDEKDTVHQNIYGTDDDPIEEETWQTLYGEDVTMADIEKAMLTIALYRKYYSVLSESFGITEEKINSYYEENRDTIDTVTVRMVPFEYYDGSRTAAEAKKAAQTFVDSVSAEDEIYEKAQAVISDSMKEYFGETDFTLAYNITRDYFTSKAATRWLFNDSRQYMDTFVFDTGTMYIALFYIEKDTKAYYPVSFRHVLLTDTSDSGAETAAKLLEAWRENDNTENGFSTLAMLYSADETTAVNGGLYENVYRGQMIEELSEWVFDSERKPGDSAVLLTSYGYHLMYFVSSSTETYRSLLCRSALESTAYKAYIRSFSDIKAVYDEEKLMFVFEEN